MTVLRLTPNLTASPETIALAGAFYADIFDLALVMDHGWIQSYGSTESMSPQLSIATEGGAGTPVPDLSIEVDNFDEIQARLTAVGIPILYGPKTEPWGVHRLYVKDPLGRLINILMHAKT